jgi:hypothetical protein
MVARAFKWVSVSENERCITHGNFVSACFDQQFVQSQWPRCSATSPPISIRGAAYSPFVGPVDKAGPTLPSALFQRDSPRSAILSTYR